MSDDVVDLVFCPLCKKPLKAVHPDAIDFKGQTVHKECAEKALEEGKPRNNSYT